MEKTFIMIKPDGVQRGLIGEVIQRFERKGLQLVAGKMLQISRAQAEKHYAEHQGKEFFERLITFITSGPVFAMVWEGDRAVALSRALIGKTDALEATPGSIRADFAVHKNFNIVHGSDSTGSAEREIDNFFTSSELMQYERAIQQWI